MLCLHCLHLWPAESIYCSVCRLPFNARKCGHGHSNPHSRSLQTCLICNQGPLTGAVYGLPLTWLNRCLAFLVLLFAWRWTWDHIGLVLRTLCRVSVWAVSVAFDTKPQAVTGSLTSGLVWLLGLFIVSYALPRNRGAFIRTGLQSGIRRIEKLFRLVWSTVQRLL